MVPLRQILQMLSNGIPQVEICGLVRCSKRTVSGYRKMASMSEKSFEELLALSDGELETIFMPPKTVSYQIGGHKKRSNALLQPLLTLNLIL